MKQLWVLCFFLFILTFSTHAQEGSEVMATFETGSLSPSTKGAFAMLQDGDDEYIYFENTTEIWPRWEDNEYNVTEGAPIVTTKAASKSEAIYRKYDLKMLKGDKIIKIGYIGYNPGAEVQRHVVIWMQNCSTGLGQVNRAFEAESKMTKVFEGDIVIKSGGNAEEWIQLFDITLDEPFEFDNEDVRITMLSYGDVSSHDVYFARSNYINSALCSTSDQLEDVSANPEYDKWPQLRFTVATKVENLTGQVWDQDGNPVVDAEVTLTSCKWVQLEYHGQTDNEGRFQVKAPGNNTFLPSAKATGFVPFVEASQKYSFYDDFYFMTPSFEDKKMDFTLFNALDFKAGEAGTIILPVEPDSTLGKYYQLGCKVFDSFFNLLFSVLYSS